VSVTPPSSWPWLDHPVSGLRLPTESPCSDSLSLRLPYSVKLAGKRKSLTHYTKGTPSSQLNEPSGFPELVCRSGSPSAACASLAIRPSSPRFDRRLRQITASPGRSISSWRSFATRYARGKEPRRCIKLGLRLFVCMRFQDLFHSPPGVLFAFPSRYWFAIGRSRVFSLGGWSPHLQTGFHVSRPTCLAPSSTPTSSVTGLSPTTAGLSRPFS
jgi:hypothetical protein